MTMQATIQMTISTMPPMKKPTQHTNSINKTSNIVLVKTKTPKNENKTLNKVRTECAGVLAAQTGIDAIDDAFAVRIIRGDDDDDDKGLQANDDCE